MIIQWKWEIDLRDFSNQCKEIEENNRMISVRFQGKPFNITVIQVYAPTRNAEEAEVYGSVKNYKTLTF